MTSPFLSVPEKDWIAWNDLAFAVFDQFPVSKGHVLVVTRRVVPTWFDATAEEQITMMDLVGEVKRRLDATLDPRPDGYNVGFNSGDAAGQTVPHVHVHVIPRYRGDVPNPRGGVRHVIPGKGDYPGAAELASVSRPRAPSLHLATGHPGDPLWAHLSDRLGGAKALDVLVSFVQLSGLDVIEEPLFAALRGGARVRIVAGDYLFISDPRALARLLGWVNLADEEFGDGRFAARLVECAKLPQAPSSFHPKAWRIIRDTSDTIIVGSSNLSGPALKDGLEWNLISTGMGDQPSHRRFGEEFDALWQIASPLTQDVVRAYARVAAASRARRIEPEAEDLRAPLLGPRPWQIEALANLSRIRETGCTRALVAVATGMGKTWLAAFDIQGVGQRLGRCPRVLVIAHRAHILAQAETVITRVLDEAWGPTTASWCLGPGDDLSGALVVASVQKLARPEGLRLIAQEHFDYAVIDEVHHAHAPSYRRVLARLNADFVLGLTATPERSDGVDVATIFDDNLAHQATIGDGIAEEALVPFHYLGLKDTVDFQEIPWRNGRFDPEELERRVARSERMERLWAALGARPTRRSMFFCCSKRHAIFVRDWLRSRGMSAGAVFSGVGGDDYGACLEGFRAGELQALCAVDMFNEGLDIPAVDRIVMLRPTESRVLFMQQIGRGLRASEGKTHLEIIDFVGNHRVFARKLVHILSLRHESEQWAALRRWLERGEADLPEGCLLDVEVEAKDMLRQFLPRGRDAVIEGYRAFRDDMGRRPTMAEMVHRGFLPKTVAGEHGGWFAFVAAEGDLSEEERQTSARFVEWLRVVETTALNRSYKMVVLRVLLDLGLLWDGVDLGVLAKACRRFLVQHPMLKWDLEGDGHALDHVNASDDEWARWWISWPIDRWLNAQGGKSWFAKRGNLFAFSAECAEKLRPVVDALTAEIVDCRIAQYSRRRRIGIGSEGEPAFEAKVSHSKGRPILFVPPKEENPTRPTGPTDVRLPDGDVWEFKFVKVACNVATRFGSSENELPALLRGWFGPNAGVPGTDFIVRFEQREGVWHALPRLHLVACESGAAVPCEEFEDVDVQGETELSVPIESRFVSHLPVYDLAAAAGAWGPEGRPEIVGWRRIDGEKLREGMFVGQVLGHSMEPRIASRSWCLFRPCPAGSREGRLLLVQLSTHADPEGGGRYTVKRYRSTKAADTEEWSHQTITLEPLNPAFTAIAVTPELASDLRIVGEFVKVLGGPSKVSV